KVLFVILPAHLAMRDRPATLAYSANEQRLTAPRRSDWYIALFTIIAAVAGLIGLLGVVAVVVMWAKPAWFFDPSEPPAPCLFVLGLLFYGVALTLAFVAALLARRRAQPAGRPAAGMDRHGGT